METTGDADNGTDAARTSPETTSRESQPGLPPVLFLLVAIAAGAASFGVCRTVLPIFNAPLELLVPMPPPEVAVAREAALSKARILNATVALGIFALLTGGLLAAAETAARRFDGGALMRLGVGVVAGTVLGCLSGLIGQFLMEQLRPVEALTPIARTTIVQICTFGILGLAVGAAVATVAGGRGWAPTSVGAGLLSGILAGLLFPVLCAFFMHRAKTEGVAVPGGVILGRVEPWAFALWIGSFVVAAGLLIPLVTRGKTSTAALEQHDPSGED